MAGLPDLSRMDIEEAGRTPQLIVSELHRQLGAMPPPIPVQEIAHALHIERILVRPLRNFEGVLLTNRERTDGEILVNETSGPARQRYTIAHELGHFLCTWHQEREGSFMCTSADMIRSAAGTGAFDQEAEANRFAIELLAPHRLVARHLRGLPELEKVLEMAIDLDVSKQAAARRYVELHPEPLAVLFCLSGRLHHLSRGAAFPWIALQIGDALPAVPQASGGSSLSEVEEVDPDDWVRNAGRAVEIAAQVLRQANGWSTVLLHAATPASEDDRD